MDTQAHSLKLVRDVVARTGEPFTEHHHRAANTINELLALRDPLQRSLKALLMRVEDGFVLVAVPAMAQLDTGKLRAALRVDSIRYPSLEELAEEVNIAPCHLPPFGHPVLPFPLLVDQAIVGGTDVVISTGSPTESIALSCHAYLVAARPQWVARVT